MHNQRLTYAVSHCKIFYCDMWLKWIMIHSKDKFVTLMERNICD